jgi:hypothetical protein
MCHLQGKIKSYARLRLTGHRVLGVTTPPGVAHPVGSRAPPGVSPVGHGVFYNTQYDFVVVR